MPNFRDLLQSRLEGERRLIEILESCVVGMMERQVDLFSPKPQSDASCSLHDSGDWKEVAIRYAEENRRLKAQLYFLGF